MVKNTSNFDQIFCKTFVLLSKTMFYSLNLIIYYHERHHHHLFIFIITVITTSQWLIKMIQRRRKRKTYPIIPHHKRHLAKRRKPINQCPAWAHIIHIFCAFLLKPSNETTKKGPHSYSNGTFTMIRHLCVGTFLHHPQSQRFLLSFFGGETKMKTIKVEIFFSL